MIFPGPEFDRFDDIMPHHFAFRGRLVSATGSVGIRTVGVLPVKISGDSHIEGDSETELREAFEKLYDRCLQDINEGDESSYIFKHHISRIEQQLSYYDRTYAWQDDKDRAVVDYIASMTDGYFCELTSKLFPGLEFPHRTYINER